MKGPAAASAGVPAQPLPAGAVSNRLDSHGRPLENAIALLLDQLNTTFDNTAAASPGRRNSWPA